MRISCLFFFLFFIMVTASPSLWAQPAVPAAPVSQDAAGVAPAPAVSAPGGAPQENAPDTEPETPERDPFLTWIPPKISSTDIFSPGGGGQGGEPEKPVFDPKVYKVTGIVWGIEKAKAIINGNIVGVGDKVKDAEIVRIDRDGILLRFQDDEYLLKREIIDGGNSEEEEQ